MQDESNPYAAPAYVEPLPRTATETEAERVRRAHLGHEASLLSWGGLCVLAGTGGAIVILLIFVAAAARWTNRGTSAGDLVVSVVGAVICGAVSVTTITIGRGFRRL